MGVPAALLDIPTENPVNPLLMPSVGIAALPSGFGSMEGNGGSGNVTMLFRPTAVQRFEGSAVKLTTGVVAGLAGLVAFIFLLWDCLAIGCGLNYKDTSIRMSGGKWVFARFAFHLILAWPSERCTKSQLALAM